MMLLIQWWWWWLWWWIVFVVWLTDERRLALFPAGTIVRDPHHLESPSRVWTCAEPEFKLSWMKLCSSDNHYTTAPRQGWRTLEMPLDSCETNLVLTWSENCPITSSIGARTLAVTDTNVNVLLVSLKTENKIKLLQQLKLGFKRTVSWNNY